MKEDLLGWLLPESDPLAREGIRRVISALRCLRDDARVRAAHRVAPSWRRAEDELARVERRARRRALAGLLHAYVAALRTADSFLDLGPRPMEYPAALRALLAWSAAPPGPAESPRAVVERLLAEAAALGAPQRWRAWWSACLQHVLAPPRAAERRWEALSRFARERHHLLVTNGPYLLERAVRRRVELGVFRDFSYPLGVGSFNRFSIPVRAFPARVEMKGAELEVHADLERVERFGREHRVSRGALGADWATRDAAAVPECHWLALGADDAVVGAGVASPTPAGTFAVRLPERSRVRQVLVALPVNGHWTQVEVRSVRVE